MMSNNIKASDVRPHATRRMSGDPTAIAVAGAARATARKSSDNRSRIFPPVFFNRLRHFLAGAAQPVRLSSSEVPQYPLDLLLCSQVDIRRFHTHGMEKGIFIAFFRQLINLDRVRIRRKAPDEPSFRIPTGTGREIGRLKKSPSRNSVRRVLIPRPSKPRRMEPFPGDRCVR